MARSKLDTLVYATILLAPMVTAVAYIAATPATELVLAEAPPMPVAVEPTPIVIAMPVAPPAPIAVPEPVPEDSPPPVPTEPAPAPDAPPTRAPDPLPDTPGAAMLMYEGQLVLATNPDLAWARGKLRGSAEQYTVAVYKAADRRKLPATLAPVIDARVVVYDADGSSCTATTGAMTIFARQDGDGYFEGGEVDENGERLISPEQLLALRESVFAEAQLLLAHQRRESDDGRKDRCAGLWARRADLPAPTVFAQRMLDADSDAALKAAVLATLPSQPAVAKIRAAYDAYLAESRDYEVPGWTAWLDTTVFISRWDEVGGQRSFVNVEVGDGGESCSSDTFIDRSALLFALQGETLVPQADPGFFGPQALMDLERDGTLEAVVDSGTTLRTSTEDGALQSFQIPYYGCPC